MPATFPLSMKLTALLNSARARYGHEVHLRELPDGRRQVIRYRARDWVGARDSSGVEVVAETLGRWRDLGISA